MSVDVMVRIISGVLICCWSFDFFWFFLCSVSCELK